MWLQLAKGRRHAIVSLSVRLCLPLLEYEMQNLCNLQRLETQNITSKTLTGSQRRRRLPHKDVALNPTMILPQEETSPVHEGVRAFPQAALRRKRLAENML